MPAVKGTTVHKALELLFEHQPDHRTLPAAQICLETALDMMAEDEDYQSLALSAAQAEAFAVDASQMVDRYFTLEDPSHITAVGTEIMLETQLGDVLVRGIIDRLEEDENGDLVVTDYKTGRTPSAAQEQQRLGGVHFYAFLCEKVLGKRPAKVQLMYLGGNPQIITALPSEQSVRGIEKKIGAVWSAIERACADEDFRPKKSPLCNWCAFQEYCPEFGGDPNIARELGAAARGQGV